MIGHLKYLSYVLRHKWYVLVECWKVGIVWRGLIHDLSKFLPSEWFPYANYFYRPRPKQSVGYMKPVDSGDAAFDFAWLLHQKRNDHHFQWWILPEDDGDTKVLPMSDAARREMLADWRGAGRAQGYGDNTLAWYLKNKDKMRLHTNARRKVEAMLDHPMSAWFELSHIYPEPPQWQA